MKSDAATTATSLPTLSIVIPAYNEQGRLGRTLTETLSFLRLQSYESELLVVDDGSRDETAALTEAFVKESPGVVRLIRNPGNRGKGFAVRSGMLNAKGEVVLFFDADLSTPLSEIDRVLLPLLHNESDVAVGTRLAEQRNTQTAFRRFLGNRFQQLRMSLLGLPVSDTQCGFKAFRRDAARAIFGEQSVEGFAFDVELLVIAQRQGWRALEVPVQWEHRDGSKVRPVASGLQMAKDLLRIKWHHGPKRRYQRYPTGAAVRVLGGDGEPFDCFVSNISRGGLFILTDHKAPIGTPLTAQLPMPNGELVPLPARVVRVANSNEAGTGMGLEFTELPEHSARQLEAFLRHIGGT